LLTAIVRALRREVQRRSLSREALLGAWGEDLAARYLQAQGLRLHARNWRPRHGFGEIDLVATEKGVLVFIEVKSRTTGEYGSPDRAIGIEKRRAMAAAARRFYNSNAFAPRLYRFDTVTIVWPGFPSHPRRAVVEHLRDAFLLDGIELPEWKPHVVESIGKLHAALSE